MNKRLLWIGFVILAAAALLGLFFVARKERPPPATTTVTPTQMPRARFEDFVGAEACAKCHGQQYDLWRRSTHGKAGGKPGQVEIIAHFDGQPLQFRDAIVMPGTNPQGDYVFFVQLEGAPPFQINVDTVVGGGHMQGGGTQSFFNEFPDGTLRFLPFDFARRENVWFTQLRSNKTWVPISHDLSLQTDLLNWPPNRVLGTSVEFSNCQNCHGSQIALTYDLAQRKHRTRFQTLQINCESCHGPGQRHVEIMSQPGSDKLPDIGMEPLAALSKDASLTVCFQCHATKDAIRDDPYLPGEALEDYFSIKLPLFADNPYRVDGRIRSFGYQGNHLYSDCYLNGSMTCVDCHDPHSMEYRDIFQRPLMGRFDNRQCTGCHASKAIAPESHSHHARESPGNLCTSCHMPYLQHQGVGSHITFARSDHTIPIPRPAFDASIGIENACQKCHHDKDLAWQENKIREWYAEIKPHHPLIADLIEAEKNPSEAPKRLLAPQAAHPMAQVDGLSQFIRAAVKPNTRLEAAATLRTFSRSPDPDLQALALMALHVSGELDLSAANASSPVRSRWAILADQLAGMFSARDDLVSAIICLEKSLEVMPTNVVTLSHLAFARANAGEPQNAVALLKKAIAIRPHASNLHFQLAQIYLGMEQPTAAIQALEEGLRYAPENRPARAFLQQLRALSPTP